MRIILAGPRGFCAGVNMAIESLETALRLYGTPVYVYHEIVHNKWVVEHFRQRGVVFVNDLAEVPPGAHLLYSAHGVSPEVRRQAAERGLQTIDATCPLVTKVHRKAIRYAAAGYTIVLIGHAGHDEVVGTMGEATAALVLVQTPEDVDRLEVADPKKLAYLTQTTLSVDEAARTVERLRQRFPKIVGPESEDICYATQNRQEAVRALPPGRHRADRGQPEQFQQPPAGRDRPVQRRAVAPDRRAGRHRPELVQRRRAGADYGRGQCAGKRGPGVHRLAGGAVRRPDRVADPGRGEGSFPAARAVAQPGGNTQIGFLINHKGTKTQGIKRNSTVFVGRYQSSCLCAFVVVLWTLVAGCK